MMRIRYLREVVTPEAAAGMPQEVRDIPHAMGAQLVQDGYAVQLKLPEQPKPHHGLPVVAEHDLLDEDE